MHCVHVMRIAYYQPFLTMDRIAVLQHPEVRMVRSRLQSIQQNIEYATDQQQQHIKRDVELRELRTVLGEQIRCVQNMACIERSLVKLFPLVKAQQTERLLHQLCSFVTKVSGANGCGLYDKIAPLEEQLKFSSRDVARYNGTVVAYRRKLDNLAREPIPVPDGNPFEWLPDEIVSEIFTHLGPEGIMESRLLTTCRRFRGIIHCTPTLQRQFLPCRWKMYNTDKAAPKSIALIGFYANPIVTSTVVHGEYIYATGGVCGADSITVHNINTGRVVNRISVPFEDVCSIIATTTESIYFLTARNRSVYRYSFNRPLEHVFNMSGAHAGPVLSAAVNSGEPDVLYTVTYIVGHGMEIIKHGKFESERIPTLYGAGAKLRNILFANNEFYVATDHCLYVHDREWAQTQALPNSHFTPVPDNTITYMCAGDDGEVWVSVLTKDWLSIHHFINHKRKALYHYAHPKWFESIDKWSKATCTGLSHRKGRIYMGHINPNRMLCF
jgi:hypothetical protein